MKHIFFKQIAAALPVLLGQTDGALRVDATIHNLKSILLLKYCIVSELVIFFVITKVMKEWNVRTGLNLPKIVCRGNFCDDYELSCSIINYFLVCCLTVYCSGKTVRHAIGE